MGKFQEWIYIYIYSYVNSTPRINVTFSCRGFFTDLNPRQLHESGFDGLFHLDIV